MTKKRFTRLLPLLLFLIALLGVSAACRACLGPGEGLPPGDRPARWAAPVPDVPGLPNLFRVDGGLYRGAQPEVEGYGGLRSLGVRTVVNLRSGDDAECAACARNGLEYVNIPCHAFNAEQEKAVAFLRVAADPARRPVFVHCKHGADRTGMMVALYRVVVQGWSKEEAIREMKEGGYGFHRIWWNLAEFIRDTDPEALRAESGLPPAGKGK